MEREKPDIEFLRTVVQRAKKGEYPAKVLADLFEGAVNIIEDGERVISLLESAIDTYERLLPRKYRMPRVVSAMNSSGKEDSFSDEIYSSIHGRVPKLKKKVDE